MDTDATCNSDAESMEDGGSSDNSAPTEEKSVPPTIK
jgi:hypothetical protein